MSTRRPLCAMRTHGLAALVSLAAFIVAAFVAPRAADELTAELALTFLAMPLLCGSWLLRWEAHASERWWRTRYPRVRTIRTDSKAKASSKTPESPALTPAEKPPTVSSGVRARKRSSHAAA